MKFFSLLVLGLLSASAEANFSCLGNICVGDHVVNVSSNNRLADVVAIQPNATFSLRFYDNGGIGHGWQQIDLAPTKGCAYDLCVGQRVFNRYNNRYATVYAIQFGPRFVLLYEDTRTLGNGWDRNDLIPQEGSATPVCPPGTVWDPALQRCVSVVTPPPPQPHRWVCSVPNQYGRVFTAISNNRDLAARQALINCSNASGGYVCRGSDVRCYVQ